MKLLPPLHFEIRYQPERCRQAGTYVVRVGPFSYYGSSQKIGSRVSFHRLELERGNHPNARLQAAWNLHHSFELFILDELERKEGEPEADFIQRLRLREQWLLDAWFGTEFCVNLSGDARFNSRISDILREKWQDPEFRAEQVRVMQAGRPEVVAQETREKMAEKKRGKGNPNSRTCIVKFNGETLKFDCATDAARHFGVSQQVVHGWLNGSTPGTRKETAHLKGLTAAYKTSY